MKRRIVVHAYTSDPGGTKKNSCYFVVGCKKKQKKRLAWKHRQKQKEKFIPIIDFAANLRKAPTQAEAVLAYILKQNSFPFEQQKIFGRKIVDFFLPEYNLAIEVDGVHHHDCFGSRRDKIRGWYFYRNFPSVKFLRFDNSELLSRSDTLTYITKKIQAAVAAIPTPA